MVSYSPCLGMSCLPTKHLAVSGIQSVSVFLMPGSVEHYMFRENSYGKEQTLCVKLSESYLLFYFYILYLLFFYEETHCTES